jgi:peptide/nickel transport system ATP-binding protein
MIFQDPYAEPQLPLGGGPHRGRSPSGAFDLDRGRARHPARVGECSASSASTRTTARNSRTSSPGGQRQRIAIAARARLQREFIVCDEPDLGARRSVQAQILNLMRDLQDRFGLTYLFISHNLAVVRHMASRIGVMYLGRIVEVSGGRELFSAPKHPYTRMLLEAVPDIAMTGKGRVAVKGEIPSPINPPSGCTFNPRCPFANERCRTEVPPLDEGVACHAVHERRIDVPAAA